MAKISTYPIDTTPTLTDKVIGTDVNDSNITKNYTIGNILGLIGFVEVTVNVSSSELIDLQSTPKVLVPAQGPGTYIKVLEISLYLKFNTTPYTQAAEIEFIAGGDFQASLPNASGVLTSPTDVVASLQMVPEFRARIDENTALSMQTPAAIAAGDSSLKVKVKYQVLDTANF